MHATAGRLLELLSLLQARSEWSGPQLAERLGVTERTVRRDVGRLRGLGYTIDSTVGAAGGYRLGAGAGIPPLLLSADEAVAVAVALRSSALAGLAGIDERAIQALLKLESSLPAALRHRVETIQETVLTIEGPGPSLDLDVLTSIASATRDRRQLTLDYTTHRGALIRRTVQPHRIVRMTDRWYLVAWDLRAEDWRTLRLDRIDPGLRSGPTFSPRPLGDAEVLAPTSGGVTDRPYRWHARLTALVPAAEAGEVIGPTRSRLTPIDDATTLVEGGGDDLAAMALWILSLPFDVLVHEPREVLPHLERLGMRARAAATGSPGSALAPPPEPPAAG